jgi:DNA polymerase
MNTPDKNKLIVTNCFRCDLCLHRNNIVSGEGSLTAKMMFVGEAPGYSEDKQGKPFVGKAGRLLQYYLDYFGWEREDIYITNVIKCKTPHNRVPTAKEINNCKEYFIKELIVVSPKILVLFGNTAISTVIGIDNKVKRLAGHPFRYKDIIIMPMFHPSYIDRNKELSLLYVSHWKLLFAIFKRVVPSYQHNPKY